MSKGSSYLFKKVGQNLFELSEANQTDVRECEAHAETVVPYPICGDEQSLFDLALGLKEGNAVYCVNSEAAEANNERAKKISDGKAPKVPKIPTSLTKHRYYQQLKPA